MENLPAGNQATTLRDEVAERTVRSRRGEDLSHRRIQDAFQAFSRSWIQRPLWAVGLGYDVFISHAHADAAGYAAALANELAERGRRTFLDQHPSVAEEQIPSDVRRALIRSSVLVVIVSPKAVHSKHVADEIREFRRTGRPICPVATGGVSPPHAVFDEIPGVAPVDETASAWMAMEPSERVVTRILASANYVAQSWRTRFSIAIAGGVLFALVLVSLRLVTEISALDDRRRASTIMQDLSRLDDPAIEALLLSRIDPSVEPYGGVERGLELLDTVLPVRMIPIWGSASFSPGGRWLLHLGVTNHVWDTTNWEPVRTEDANSNSFSLTVSPDDRWLFISVDWTSYQLEDLQGTNEPLRLESGELPFEEFSPDSRWLALKGTDDYSIQLVDIVNGRVHQYASERRDPGYTFSANAEYIATWPRNGSTVSIRKPADWSSVATLQVPKDVDEVRFHPHDPEQVAVSTEDRLVLFKRVGEVFESTEIEGEYTLSWSPSGDQLLTTKGHDVRILTRDNETESVVSIPHSSDVHDAWFLNDDVVVTEDGEGIVRSWSISSFEPQGYAFNWQIVLERFETIAPSADGVIYYRVGDIVEIRDASSGATTQRYSHTGSWTRQPNGTMISLSSGAPRIHDLNGPNLPRSDAVAVAPVSNVSDLILFEKNPARLVVWNPLSSDRRVAHSNLEDAERMVAFSPNGRWVVTSNRRLQRTLWDMSVDGERYFLDSTASAKVASNGTVLLSSGYEVRVVNPKANIDKLIQPTLEALQGDSIPLSGAEISPDGELVAINEYHRLRLVSVRDTSEEQSIPQPLGVIDMAFNPNRDELALLVREFGERKIRDYVRFLSYRGELSEVFDAPKNSDRLAFSKDGNRIAFYNDTSIYGSADDPRTVVVSRKTWDTLAEVAGWAEFSPDGEWLLGLDIITSLSEPDRRYRLPFNAKFTGDGQHLIVDRSHSDGSLYRHEVWPWRWSDVIQALERNVLGCTDPTFASGILRISLSQAERDTDECLVRFRISPHVADRLAREDAVVQN